MQAEISTNSIHFIHLVLRKHKVQIGCLILNLFNDDIWMSDWN